MSVYAPFFSLVSHDRVHTVVVRHKSNEAVRRESFANFVIHHESNFPLLYTVNEENLLPTSLLI
jgi:hypothetical protein